MMEVSGEKSTCLRSPGEKSTCLRAPGKMSTVYALGQVVRSLQYVPEGPW